MSRSFQPSKFSISMYDHIACSMRVFKVCLMENNREIFRENTFDIAIINLHGSSYLGSKPSLKNKNAGEPFVTCGGSRGLSYYIAKMSVKRHWSGTVSNYRPEYGSPFWPRTLAPQIIINGIGALGQHIIRFIYQTTWSTWMIKHPNSLLSKYTCPLLNAVWDCAQSKSVLSAWQNTELPLLAEPHFFQLSQGFVITSSLN